MKTTVLTTLFLLLPAAACAQNTVDQILMFDRSGSMSGDNFVAAKNASNLYIDLSRQNDGLAIVPFHTNVSPAPFNIARVSIVPNVRANAENYVDALNLGNLTSIGDAFRESVLQSQATETGNSRCTFLLASDGINNADLYWDDVSAKVKESGCQGHIIAIGPSAHETQFQSMAHTTQGRYFYVPDHSGSDDPTISRNLALADLHEYASTLAHEGDRLLGATGAVPTFRSEFELPPDQIHDVYVDNSVSEVWFTLDWWSANEPDCDNPVVSNGCFGKDLELRLVRPDGTVISPSDVGYTFEDIVSGHVGWRIDNPMPGTWTMVVNADSFYVWYDVPYRAFASGRSAIHAELMLDDQTGQRHLTGAAIPIQALIAANQPLNEATVIASVTAPDGQVTSVSMCDDGMHNDGAANDGLYAGTYTRANQAQRIGTKGEFGGILSRALPEEGSYQVELDLTLGQIRRSALGAIAVRRDLINLFHNSFEAAPEDAVCEP